MTPSASIIPAAPTPTARVTDTPLAPVPTAPTSSAIAPTIASNEAGVGARRSATMDPSSATSAARTFVPPRSTPTEALLNGRRATALLAHHPVGRVEQRPRGLEQRVGRLE